MEKNPATRTIFFHIPKTAGQTFTNLINRQFSGSVIDTNGQILEPEIWAAFLEKLKTMPVEELQRIQAVTGHMRFGLHEFFPGPTQYITFLREPVKRFISFYLMAKRLGLIPAEHQFDEVNFQGPEQPWLTREMDNGQTRILANARWDLPFGACTEEHLQTALTNLDQYFVFVGLTERFDMSMRLLNRLCGWPTRFYVPKNVAPQAEGSSVSKAVETKLSELNTLDRRLYAYAVKRFQHQVREGGAALRMHHRLFKMANGAHGMAHNIVRPLKKRLRGQSEAAPAQG